MIRLIDNLLNRVTMYRLALYYTVFLLGTAIILSIGQELSIDPLALMFTTSFLLVVCWLTNRIFAWAYNAPANVESVYISALILALIVTPLTSYKDLWFIGWMAVLAMASKYIIAIQKKHLFNPVAFGIAMTAVTINQTASWWVASPTMLPFVLIGGLLLVRKIRRFKLVLSFLITALMTSVVYTLVNQQDVIATLQNIILYSPLIFFAFIILTEPLTAPPTRRLQITYGVLVGVLFVPDFHIGEFYLTPEIAILVGNLFAYIVSPKAKLILNLRDKLQLAPDVYEFVFQPSRALAFQPGQYMEWTLPHKDPDKRGNRRYFTLASAPTESTIRLGVKFYPKSSSYKHSMLEMDATHEIVAAQIAGDFVLPSDQQQKCVLIAGGIGITPFRSMLKYLIDTHQERPLVLLYSNKSAKDIVYKDVLSEAELRLGTKVVYTISNKENLPASWNGRVGRVTKDMIQEEVPDYSDCIFYISGPNSMVDGVKDALHQLNIPSSNIKTDYFSGLA